jgi:hypothetical protein
MWSVEDLTDQPIIRVVERFDDFYRREFSAVVGLAYALSGNRWAAEDLAQESFLVAHRDWDRVGTYDDPGAWVRRVVTNLSVSALRRRMIEAKALRGSHLVTSGSSRTWSRPRNGSGARSGRSRDGSRRWWRSTTSKTDPCRRWRTSSGSHPGR